MDVAFAEHAGAFTGDAVEIDCAGPIHLEEGAKHGGDEERSPVVRFGRFLQYVNIRLVRLPFSSLRIDLAQGVPQGASTAGRLPELLGELPKQILAGEIAPCPRDLVAQDAWIG